ncbi:MAG: hypothetical protein ACREP1_13325 [Rhodanobacteraceae bacterium]
MYGVNSLAVSLRWRLEEALSGAPSLDAVLADTLDLLALVRADVARLGLVSGAITADGPERLDHNIGVLLRHAEHFEEREGLPLIAAPYVFTAAVYERIGVRELAERRFHEFWRAILTSGHVTDVFMTRGWERSNGATDEYLTAQKLGLAVREPCIENEGCASCKESWR